MLIQKAEEMYTACSFGDMQEVPADELSQLL